MEGSLPGGESTAWDRVAEHQFQLIRQATVADIQKMLKDADGKDCCIAEANGIRLRHSTSNRFQVTAPKPDGKRYTFKWQNFTVPLS